MGLPQKSYDDKPMSQAELDRFLDNMNYHDRQDSIEVIYDIAKNIKSCANPQEMFTALEEITSVCGEFV